MLVLLVVLAQPFLRMVLLFLRALIREPQPGSVKRGLPSMPVLGGRGPFSLLGEDL